MQQRFISYSLALILILSGVAPAFAKKDKGAASAPLVNLTQLIAPPPAQDSDQTKAELQEIHRYQDTRTDVMAAYAKADLDKSVFRFSDVLGPNLKPDTLPLTQALFDQAVKAGSQAVAPVKKLWNRPRPFTFDPTVKPCVDEDDTGLSYPSGHATAGTIIAILLANMVPEKKAEIFARGWAYCMNRVISGVHYRSDIEAGRICGTVVAAELLKDHKFMKKFEAAKAELRAALGYPNDSNDSQN
jgi:acid phosphatase (class A)